MSKAGTKNDNTDINIKRPLLGLAIGSGASRGLAHIGVLDVIKT